MLSRWASSCTPSPRPFDKGFSVSPPRDNAGGQVASRWGRGDIGLPLSGILESRSPFGIGDRNRAIAAASASSAVAMETFMAGKCNRQLSGRGGHLRLQGGAIRILRETGIDESQHAGQRRQYGAEGHRSSRLIAGMAG